jgi:hypothetical protein
MLERSFDKSWCETPRSELLSSRDGRRRQVQDRNDPPFHRMLNPKPPGDSRLRSFLGVFTL